MISQPKFTKLTQLVLRTCITAAVSLTLCNQAQAQNSKINPPKLVVVMVVDGLPHEQVVRYRHQFTQGGFRRLLEQGAWFTQAHQGHGVTLTAVGHAAVLTGAYPYHHGIISNKWVVPQTLEDMYCTADTAHQYLGEETKKDDGTSPKNLRVTTLGDELRYATGKQAKVVTVSGKDRGAILLAGKTGTAYMYMEKSGNFASSSYYMQQHPQWVSQHNAAKPQDKYYGERWNLLLPESAYQADAADDIVTKADKADPKSDNFNRFPFIYSSESGKPDASYYKKLKTGPYVDQLTLDFARAAIEGENLGKNPAGVTDILGISLSSHDYVNHSFGPESRMSHDHLQRLDRMMAEFFSYLDKRIGLDNVIITLTADHGFPNVPEFSQTMNLNAQRFDTKNLLKNLNDLLNSKYGSDKLISKWSYPGLLINWDLVTQKGIKRDELEALISDYVLKQDGIANVFSRSQLENGLVPATRLGTLMQRAWNKQVSPDMLLVTKPFWYFGEGMSGTSHGSPYFYDTNVPLMIMGKNWIKPGNYTQGAEVQDLAPTLAHILRLRAPAASEGRILGEILR